MHSYTLTQAHTPNHNTHMHIYSHIITNYTLTHSHAHTNNTRTLTATNIHARTYKHMDTITYVRT